MLTVNPNQITVSESENNLSPQQVKSSSEARSLDNKLLSESEVPEVVASEEITSSPPFIAPTIGSVNLYLSQRGRD